MGEQRDQLSRVYGRIGQLVRRFCSQRAHAGGMFHMDELVVWLSQQTLAAPDSPSRILRYLRGAGLVDYVVVNRRQSLYRITRVAEPLTGAGGGR